MGTSAALNAVKKTSVAFARNYDILFSSSRSLVTTLTELFLFPVVVVEMTGISSMCY